jgi:hypothetical protein
MSARETGPRLVQCLCPGRHAILALAFEDDSVTDDDALDMLQKTIAMALDPAAADPALLRTARDRGLPEKIDPFCGICGAAPASWRYEVSALREKRWVRAIAELKAVEADQKQTAAILKRIGLGYSGRRN